MDSHELPLCPVCSASLGSTNERYTVGQLFAMWAPVRFSEATVQEHREQSEVTELYRCPVCRLEIFLPQIIATPQFYVEAYNLDGSQAESDFSYSETKWDFDVALTDASGLQRVLEIGCGPGHFLDRVSPITHHVMGVESNPKALEIVRAKGYRAVGDLRENDPLKGSFDAVFSFHVLEHVPEPLKFLRDAAEWVRPGGLVAVSLPNRAGPLRFVHPCIQDMPPHHATRWRRKTFDFVARRLGWRIQRVAFEPLTAATSYYYSMYLGPYWFPSQTRLHSLARRTCASVFPAAFDGLFRVLRLVGRDAAPFLKGQAMYAVFRVAT